MQGVLTGIITLVVVIKEVRLDPLGPEADFYFDILRNHYDQICKFITCNEPYAENQCPEGTMYHPNWGLHGCCGECVSFRNEGTSCSGNLDSVYNNPGFSKNRTLPKVQSTKAIDSFSDENETDDFNNTTYLDSSIGPNLYKVNNTVRSLLCRLSSYCTNNECEVDTNKVNCRTTQFYYDSQVGDPHSSVYYFWKHDFRWRPVCLEDGSYASKQCKGSNTEDKTCVCVDPDGASIFGKAYVWQEELYNSMNCLCSRKRWERENNGEIVTVHCRENGNYEPLQCEKGWCYCVDPESGEAYSTQLPQQIVQYLPCYNRTMYGDLYLRRCDSAFFGHMAITSSLQSHGVQRTPVNNLFCDFDGSYSPMQLNPEAAQGYYCSDKYNDVTLSPAGGGCNCARDIFVMNAAGISQNLQCQTSTGMYEEVQLRNQLAYCVDNDGIRSGPLVREECKPYLNCVNAKICQNGHSSSFYCEDVCEGCPEDAYYLNEDVFSPVGKC